MGDSVNIIIPAVKVDEEVLKCLVEINKIKYHNFFVTVVLDHTQGKKLPRLRYKINKLISGKINMSKKRNIAAKKFKSKYIAFIDSDAYPNKNWLKLAIKYLKQKKGNIVGGPGIPFPNQKYLEKIGLGIILAVQMKMHVIIILKQMKMMGVVRLIHRIVS